MHNSQGAASAASFFVYLHPYAYTYPQQKLLYTLRKYDDTIKEMTC